MDTRLPYRIGYPILPVYPVRTTNANLSDHFSNPDESLVKVKQILIDCKVLSWGMQLLHRFNEGKTPEDHVTLTVNALTDKYEGHISLWKEAVQLIWNEIGRPGVLKAGSKIAVEIVDKRAFGGLISFPILGTDTDVIEQWRLLQPNFLPRLGKQEWLTIDVLYRGMLDVLEDGRKRMPTIVIGARDANDCRWWDETLPKLRQIVPKDFNVELLYVHNIYLGDVNTAQEPPKEVQEREPPRSLSILSYGDQVPIGISCGREENSSGSGTLGGPVTLQRYGACGISNHHVLCKDWTSEEPIRPGTGDRQRVVVCPSNADHNLFYAAERDALANHEARLEDICFAEKLIERPKLRQRFDNEKEQVLANLAILDQFPRRIGHVLASSGLRTSRNSRYPDDSLLRLLEKKGRAESAALRDMDLCDREYSPSLDWAVDWSLVQLTDRDFQTTHLPRSSGLNSNAKIDSYASISDDEDFLVLKYGRTSEWTAGTISAVLSIARHHHPKASELPGVTSIHQENDSVKFGKPFLCHSILLRDRSDRYYPAEFLDRGDSGSLVILEKSMSLGHPVVGLGFGHNSGSHASYMVPFDMVIDDIEKVTGDTVIEPINIGNITRPSRKSSDRKVERILGGPNEFELL